VAARHKVRGIFLRRADLSPPASPNAFRNSSSSSHGKTIEYPFFSGMKGDRGNLKQRHDL
jgi:hypothetical protein